MSDILCRTHTVKNKLGLWLCALAASLASCDIAACQENKAPMTEDGIFISVRNPITSEVMSRVKNQVEEARSGKGGRLIAKVIFDFNADGTQASSDSFGPCLDLAQYIRGLTNLTTVAFVHNKVSRHTVLPVLACGEIVMGSPAESFIGKIVDDPKVKLAPLQIKAYEDFAREGRAAIVQKMYDADVALMRGRRANGEFYFDKRRQGEAVAAGVVGAEPVYPPGELLFLNTDDAIRLGICRLGNKASRRQLLDVYGLSVESLRTDPLRGRPPVARLVTLKGEISTSLKQSVMRRIRNARDDGANMFFLHFAEIGGGSSQVAREWADDLIKIGEDEANPVMLIAYVSKKAPDNATFLVFACSEIVMTRDAAIGDFSRLRVGAAQKAGELPALREMLRNLLEQRHFEPALADAMIDIDSEVIRVQTRKGAFERRLMTGEEWAAEQKLADPVWREAGQIKAKGKEWTLNAQQAKELKVVRHVIDSEDPREMYAAYGLEPEKIRELTPDWLDGIATFLRLPWVRFLLVMVGITCLILEFKIPGATAPGVIAAICFVLFFWAQSHLSGQIIILAILLFLLGLILIGIEVFVLPGFGFVGVTGILLIVVGLGLATVERAPRTGDDWLELGAKFTQFGLGIICAGFAAIILARYLPNIPVANRMVLAPPGDKLDGVDEMSALPGVEQAAALLGVMGTAATMLRPAGMAQFGDQYVDVVTEGGFIPAGARVQVVEVEANRVVVKEV